jgi:hypothetical protein
VETKLISGGFYLAQSPTRPAWLKDSLLPQRLITLSPCLAVFFPDLWALEWTSLTEDERQESASALGIGSEQLPSVLRYVTSAYERNTLGWTRVWSSRSAAREAVEHLQLDPDHLLLLELGVPEERVDGLVAELEPGPSHGECGFYNALRSRTPMSTEGATLGWEPLGVECSGCFHSWLCNSLHEPGYERLGIKPAQGGLLKTLDEAERILDLINDGLGAEPVPWFPALLSRHML